MRPIHAATLTLLVATSLSACGGEPEPAPVEPATPAGTPVAVVDTTVPDRFEANGTALPIREATLSTRLMATVLEVLVHEGDRVSAGQVLVRLDARDLDARRAQVEAGLAEATAVQTEAGQQAGRIRALYADSAATRAQLDQVEAGLARAEAAVRMARAQAAELAATASYAEVRAPFAGIVTRRAVDPGAFAAPGAPLVTVQDASTLRVTVHAAPEAVSGLRRGERVPAVVAGEGRTATIEGIVPAAGNLHAVNALVDNRDGGLPSGAAASLMVARGTRRALLVPTPAILRQDDLTGVQVVVDGRPALRWIRIGQAFDDRTEVLSGLEAGDSVLVTAGGN